MFEDLPSSAENMLQKLIESEDNSTDYLNEIRGYDGSEKKEAIAWLSILSRKGLIKILWASDEPYEYFVLPQGRIYFQYKREKREKEKKDIQQKSIVLHIELMNETENWIADYTKARDMYKSALEKYKDNAHQRNMLDDLRLSLELLLKSIFENGKSLENQMNELGALLKSAGISVELRNMIHQIIDYYAKYQNNNVKHDDTASENENEFIMELTSILMKFLAKTKKLG